MSEPVTYIPSSGKEIEIRRVSIFTLNLAEKDLPQPQPPTQEIDGEIFENYAHPDFKVALEQWNAQKTERRIDTIYACGVKVDVDAAELADAREAAAAIGLKLPDNDKLAYIKHCVLITTEDALNVQALIMKGSLPTEEAVSQAAEDFKSPVERKTDSESGGASVGSDGRES